MQAWLAARGDHRGPSVPARAERQRLQAVALKAPSVAVIVQRYATLAGHAAGFAGHSLRSGFLTSGAEAGASIFKMMEVSRHKSVDTLRGYVRRADDLLKEHAGTAFL